MSFFFESKKACLFPASLDMLTEFLTRSLYYRTYLTTPAAIIIVVTNYQ
jgi:hypothetical protein